MTAFGAVAALPVAAVELASNAASPVTHRFSDRGWATRGGDSLPHIRFPGRAIQPMRLERTAPLSPQAQDRLIQTTGEIVLANGDGLIDRLATASSVNGRPVRIKTGHGADSYDTFKVVYEGVAESWSRVGIDNVSLRLRDRLYQFDLPVRTATFAGTGGAGGAAALKGVLQNYTLGKCFNITLQLVDEPYLVYQANLGPVRSISEVRDGGVALTPAGDVGDVWTAGAPAPGTYITSLAQGLIRCGSKPVGILTADVEGDASNGFYADRPASLIYKMADAVQWPSGEIDSAAMTLLDLAAPFTCGMFIGNQAVPARDIINVAMRSVNGFWGSAADKYLTAGIISAPASEAVMDFDDRDAIDLQFLETPSDIDPPIWQVRVGYARNWTVQTDGLFASVSEVNKARFGTEYLYTAPLEAPEVPVKFLGAQSVTIETALANESDAQIVAARILDLFKVPRRVATILVGVRGLFVRHGQTIRVTSRRFQLNGVNAVVFGHEIDASAGRVRLDILW